MPSPRADPILAVEPMQVMNIDQKAVSSSLGQQTTQCSKNGAQTANCRTMGRQIDPLYVRPETLPILRVCCVILLRLFWLHATRSQLKMLNLMWGTVWPEIPDFLSPVCIVRRQWMQSLLACIVGCHICRNMMMQIQVSEHDSEGNL